MEDPPIVSMSPRVSSGVSFAPNVKESVDVGSLPHLEPMGPTEAKESKQSKGSCGMSAGYGVLAILFWTAVIFIVTLVILILIHPSFILATNSTSIDYGKASLAALIVALTGVIIIWLIMSCSKKN